MVNMNNHRKNNINIIFDLGAENMVKMGGF